MSMTPIRVRGKRSSVQTETSKHSITSLLNLHPRNKRPVSPASHFSSPPAKLPRHAAHNIPRETLVKHAGFAAPLEQLPTELLETIFFLHPNISLPQSSPIIGNKLASKNVKTQLVLRVCSAERLDTCPCEKAALFPTPTDHAEAQSAILRVRWMTLTFIRQLIPDYITTILVRELGKRRLQWLGKGPLVTGETRSTIRQYLEDKCFTKKYSDNPPLFGNIRWRVENPPRLVHLFLGIGDGLVTIEERPIYEREDSVPYAVSLSAGRDQWRIFCGINGCKVPRQLLNAPWTTEKCDFLKFLLRGNASVDWVGTTSGEIAEQGLMQALREGNARATRLLVTSAGPGDRRGPWDIPYSPHYLAFEPEMEEFCLADPPVLRGVGVVPQTKHLRTAVLEAGCQRDVVETLLMPMAEDTNIDFEDRVILDWAIEKRLLGNERGQWLLSMLSLRAGAGMTTDCSEEYCCARAT